MAPRTYDNSGRAKQAAETSDRIVDVTEALLRSVDVGEVTLAAIAEGARVSVQTVLRHMGSRDGCVVAVAARVRARVGSQRGRARPGDVGGALDGLMDHYEADGLLILRLLAQERRDTFADLAVEEGRTFHRAWVVRCFGPLLPPGDDEAVDALVSATDLYVWKLLRLDLGRSERATRVVIQRLVYAILEST